MGFNSGFKGLKLLIMDNNV